MKGILKPKPKPIIKLPTPLIYQQDIINWLQEPDIKYVTFLKSRQSGGSFLNKLLVANWGLSTQKKKIIYITPTLKLSKLFHSEIVESLKPFVIQSNNTDLTIKFVTLTTVQFLSAEQGESIRGNQGNYVILDEAAFMDEETFQFAIRQTWLTIGEKVVLCSTPNGNQGFFYEFCQLGLNGEKGYKTKTITIYDNPFVSVEEIEQIRRIIPDKVFRQEYLGEFLEGSGTVFNNFKNCIIDKPKLTGKYFAAIDWGKNNDYTVLTVLNNINEVVEIYRINTMDYTEQVKLIASKLKKYNPIVTLSEENNIGTVVNELLKKEYKKITSITLNNTLKKEIIEGLCVAFENCKIGLPNNDLLMRELQSFSAKYNHSTGTIKYSAPNGLHDDMVISLAYAYYCANNTNKTKVVIR